ncbi:TonB-linked outer membrane protein, SusC/RagA family [bacterium A37T11]|nr:TonB-linked outer membrane protein, SusC/RagA family [bacterium A37T11]
MYKIFTDSDVMPLRLHQKVLRVMRITTLLVFITFIHVSASGLAQEVTITNTHISLRDLFREINRQTGYDFLWSAKSIPPSTAVSVNLHRQNLSVALEQIFSDLPIAYSVEGQKIIVKEKSVIGAIRDAFGLSNRSSFNTPAQNAITFRVLDPESKPLRGASFSSLSSKNTTFLGVTNAEGVLSLSVSSGDRIRVSFIGFEPYAFSITDDILKMGTFHLSLKRSTSNLDQVQVIGYGSDTKRFSVGSVSNVTAEQIENQPVTNVLLALQGQAAGLAMNATSGVPGSRVQLQIRGQNTIRGDASFKPYDQPLFIIDGTPFAPQNNNISQLSNLATGSSFNGGISQSIGMSPFNGINPMDISSVSILKDADATSIYGTQGSNGVVIITTKRGAAGKTNFNFTTNTSFNTAARTLNLMNTQQYLQVRKDAFAADGTTPTASPGPTYAPDLFIFDQNKYTDWQKLLFGNTSSNSDFHGSLSGGTLNNTFLVSAGYTKSNYNFPGDSYSNNRMTLHSALHHNSSDNHFSIDLITDYGYGQNNSPGFGGAQKVLLPPNLPDLLDADQNLLWSYNGVSLSSYQFYSYLKRKVLLQNYNLSNTLRFSYKIFSGLNISVNMGQSRNTSDERYQNPAASQNPAYPNPTAQFANMKYQSINIEPQIDYTFTVGKGEFAALLGGSYKKNTSNSNSLSGTGYANDNFLGSINGASTVSSYDRADIYKYSAGFARLKYIYDHKYIVSLTGRRDGSSNFGLGHQFGNFGSVGAGWIFSEEKAFKITLPFISYGKLSGSYGTSGSDGISSYQYQAFWQPVGYVPAFQGNRPNLPINFYNPDYSWALKKSLNVAMDLGFFNDRLLLNATFYRNREGNQLVMYPLAIQAGFSSVLQNMPAEVQNKGWEFSLNSTNIKGEDFRWTTNFNISFNRNKLLSFPNLETSSYSTQYVIGEPTSVIMSYRYKGVNSSSGLFEFYNKDGDLTSSPNYGLFSKGGDQLPITNLEVKYMGGIGNAFSYKRVKLFLFFQFASQMAPNYLSKIYQSNYQPGRAISNLPVAALDYWKEPGDHTTLQRLSASSSSAAADAISAFLSSTGAYSDDTYLRLKTMSLSYSLPETGLKKIGIKNGSIFINAQNLLTFTNYKVGDPEQFDLTAVPLQRTVAIGLNFNL